jgi:uncharacterized protein YcbX
MAAVERLRIYPVKGLDGIELETSELTPGGTLAGDREFALITDDGTRFNGKQSSRIHELSTDFDPASGTLRVEPPAGDPATFELHDEAERDRAATWFEDFFGDAPLELRRDTDQGFVDRTSMGPSVISTATLEEVASWFDDLTVESARRRLRANVEVSGVPAFWEDRFVGEDAPAFEAGGVRFEGVTPCARCAIPARDPDTGEPLPEFRTRFIEKRRETFPEWADEEAFDHYFTMMLIARVPEQFRDGKISVGDAVTVSGSREPRR